VKKLLSLALALACVPAASASPVSATLNSLGNGEDVTIQLIPVGQTSLQTFDAFAGVFNMTLNGTSFETFCIDTSHDVTVGQTYLVSQTPVESGLTNGARMEYIYATYLGDALTSDVDAAALQIALWDLVNGGQSLLTGSSFRYTDTSSPIYSQAEFYISQALAYTPPPSGSVGFWQDASASGNALDRGQSLIGPAIPGVFPNVLPVPAPSSAILAMSAFTTLGSGLWLRRRLGVAAV
jgi:hypothetical protein